MWTPLPTILGQPYLVALRVEWCLISGHAHHRVCPTLPGGPLDLPHMEASGVAHAAPDAVCALGDWMPVEGHFVILLGEKIAFIPLDVVVPKLSRIHLPHLINSGKVCCPPSVYSDRSPL